MVKVTWRDVLTQLQQLSSALFWIMSFLYTFQLFHIKTLADLTTVKVVNTVIMIVSHKVSWSSLDGWYTLSQLVSLMLFIVYKGNVCGSCSLVATHTGYINTIVVAYQWYYITPSHSFWHLGNCIHRLDSRWVPDILTL